MRKLFILLVSITISNLLYGQNKKNIVIGERLTIKSEILNSYNDNNYINYPVLYLLEGRKFFNSFSGVNTQLSSDFNTTINLSK